jgi:hypothetical protein
MGRGGVTILYRVQGARVVRDSLPAVVIPSHPRAATIVFRLDKVLIRELASAKWFLGWRRLVRGVQDLTAVQGIPKGP